MNEVSLCGRGGGVGAGIAAAGVSTFDVDVVINRLSL